MTDSSEDKAVFRKAVVLMTGTSFLVPAVGLVTAPVLARALGTAGRGELAAALAPALLILGTATLGLPEALTYYTARHPSITRRATVSAALITLVTGFLCLLALLPALDFLSAGHPDLAGLILLSALATIPALVVGPFRGAAIGRQMWTTVALERLINTAIRLVAFPTLWLMGYLDLFVAVIVSVSVPIVSGIIYLSLLRRPPSAATGDTSRPKTLARPIAHYGLRIWLGSVASMLISRGDQLLMAPLSTVRDLGLYSVATTISDVPFVVVLAVQGALFGASSRSNNAAQLASTSRLTLLATIVGCTVLGASLPVWIQPLFGPGFGEATWPTLILLLGAVICVPGLMAASGLAAWGHPGLRSFGLGITVITDLLAFVLLVPPFGVVGGCLAAVICDIVMTAFMVLTASKVTGVPCRDFLLIRRADLVASTVELGRFTKAAVTRLRAVVG